MNKFMIFELMVFILGWIVLAFRIIETDINLKKFTNKLTKEEMQKIKCNNKNSTNIISTILSLLKFTFILVIPVINVITVVNFMANDDAFKDVEYNTIEEYKKVLGR